MNNCYGITTKKLTFVPGRRPLLDGSAKVLDGRARYRLFRVEKDGESFYQLCVSYGGEMAECFVRCEREAAARLFFSLLNGRVTPCSMVCIVRESVDEGEVEVLAEI